MLRCVETRHPLHMQQNKQVEAQTPLTPVRDVANAPVAETGDRCLLGYCPVPFEDLGREACAMNARAHRILHTHIDPPVASARRRFSMLASIFNRPTSAMPVARARRMSDTYRALPAVQTTADQLAHHVEMAYQRVIVLDGTPHYRVLGGEDLRGVRLPASLFKRPLHGVKLAGCNLSEYCMREAVLCHADLRNAVLPTDLRGATFINVDLRGSLIGRYGPPPSASCWPDLSRAKLTDAKVDVFGIAAGACGDGNRAIGALLDCRATVPHSLLRCLLSIDDPSVRLAAMETLLSPVRTLALATHPDPWLDTLFEDYGRIAADARLEFALALAETVIADTPLDHSVPSMAWLCNELACELGQRARAFHSNREARAGAVIHRAGFPAPLRALALAQNPALRRCPAAGSDRNPQR